MATTALTEPAIEGRVATPSDARLVSNQTSPLSI